MGRALELRRRLNDLRALNQVGFLMSEDSHLAESGLERTLDLSLIICGRPIRYAAMEYVFTVLTNERLPLASSPRVASQLDRTLANTVLFLVDPLLPQNRIGDGVRP